MRLYLLINKLYISLIYLWTIYLAIYFSLQFKMYSFKKIAKKLSEQKTSKNIKKINILKIMRLNRSVIESLILSKNCFIRSFTSFLILKKLGYNSSLNIGIIDRKEFRSHAWLELNNMPLLESKDVNKYKVIKKF